MSEQTPDIEQTQPEYPTGSLWVSDGNAFRIPKALHVQDRAGFKRIKALYEMTDTGWRRQWFSDHTPPQAPEVAAQIVPGTRNQLSITVRIPDELRRRVVVKVSTDAPPSDYSSADAAYFHQTNAGEPWSEWFTNDRLYTAQGSTLTQTKQFPTQAQPDVSLPLGTDVHIMAWVQDSYGVWSVPGAHTIKTLSPSQLPAGVNHYVTAVIPSSVDTWDNMSGSWLHRGNKDGMFPLGSARKWVLSPQNPHAWQWQGGAGRAQLASFACYPALKQVLQFADGITSVKMPLLRRYNTAANVIGGQTVDDAQLDGDQHTTRLRMFTHPLAQIPAVTQNFQGLSLLSGGVGADFLLKGWGPGQVTALNIPQSVYTQLMDGQTAAQGIAFWDSGASKAPASTCQWDASFAMPAGTQLSKDTLSGYLIVEWYSLKPNPWPEADPAHERFKPVGIDTNTWENA